jgi:hypothetical protein
MHSMFKIGLRIAFLALLLIIAWDVRGFQPATVDQSLIVINAQVAGNGGGQDSAVLYYRTHDGTAVGGAPSCSQLGTGWEQFGPIGYGPHYLGIVGYDWTNFGSGGVGGGWGDYLQWIGSVWVMPQGGCFTGDTLISLADGSMKAIRDVAVGEEVLSYDANGKITQAPVTETFVRDVATILHLEAGDRSVTTTDEHPFFNGTEYVEAGQLKAGDTVYLGSVDGLFPVKLTKVWHEWKHEQVYNLTVDDTHTYIAGGFAVHNKQAKHPPQPPPQPLGGERDLGSDPGDNEDLSHTQDYVAFTSDSLCALDQLMVIPFFGVYQNATTSNETFIYSDACSKDSTTNLIDCNRCIICVK